jgi:hypothetical protein
MEKFEHIIKDYPFPQPSECWIKSYCKQMEIKKVNPDESNFGIIRDFEHVCTFNTFRFYNN